MKQNAVRKMSRLELYLKNMDLLNINPSITVRGIHLSLSERNDIHILLNILNEWSIRKLYIFNDIANIAALVNYFQDKGANSLLKDIDIYLNLNINKENFIRKHRDNMNRLFQTKLFCTEQYNKMQKIWGEDVFHFHGYEPEIYQIDPAKKYFEKEIRYPEDVFAVFQYQSDDSGEFQLKNCKDISDKLDKNKGIIYFKITDKKAGRLIVFRTFRIIFNKHPEYWINFAHPSNMDVLLQDHQQKLYDNEAVQIDTIYDFNTLLEGTDSDIYPNLIYSKEKNSELITNQPVIDLSLKQVRPVFY